METPGARFVSWQVTDFRVRTNTPDGTSALLFANGRMQVVVDVFIRAVDVENHRRHHLTQAELDTIQLVKYINTEILLSDPWSYSSQSNEFAKAMPASDDTVANPAWNEGLPIQTDETLDHKRYFVTTTRVESIRVAARIRQPNGRIESTNNGTSFDSSVHLTGTPPVLYTTNTITVNADVVVRDGTYRAVLHNEGLRSVWNTWTQVNYYVSTQVYPLLRARLIGPPFLQAHPNRYISLNHVAEAMQYRRMHYIWEPGAPRTVQVGIESATSWERGGLVTIFSEVPVQINQQKNSLCLTAMSFESREFVWTHFPLNRFNAGFELYDIYGNRGAFTASQSANLAEIVILNGAPPPRVHHNEGSYATSHDGASAKARL